MWNPTTCGDMNMGTSCFVKEESLGDTLEAMIATNDWTAVLTGRFNFQHGNKGCPGVPASR